MNPVFIFGKYKGQSIETVPGSYLLWLYAQDWLKESYIDIYSYINTHYDSIRTDVDFPYGFLEVDLDGCDEAYAGPEFWKDN
jgi:hypothetical protein